MKTKGTDTGEIAEHFRLSKRSVQKILKENGLADRATEKKDRKSQLEELLARQRLYQIMKEEGLK